MRPLRLATGIVLLLVGAVWALQGYEVSFAPRSFMTGDRTWLVVGIASVLVGGGLVWTSRSR